MKRFLNVRLPVILAIAVTAGIFTVCLFVYFDVSFIWFTAVIPATAVIFIICAVFDKLSLKLLFILFAVIFLTAGAANCYFRLNGYKSSRIPDGVYTVNATVCEKGENGYGEYVILKNASTDGGRLNGKIIAYLSYKYGDFCDVGYKVSFTAEISKNELFKSGKINYYMQENIKYSCNVYGGMKSEYGFSLFGNIRKAIRNTLYDNLDKDTAAIAFAMLTGNTQGIDGDTITSIRYGGVAHVFAVSGLHIGIVFGIFYFISKKLKFNKYVCAILCLFPILFYAGVCGFTLSSLRAAVMCAVSVCAKLACKKYDGLNSLSIAVIIILIITPTSLFSVGFQLSVCAAGGIIALSKNFAKPFKNKKLPKKLVNAVSVSLSAQVATFPVLLVNFGYVSGAGLLLNVLILPLLSVIFIILFLCTFISTVLSFAAPIILPIAALPLQAVISFLLDAGFENALISGFGTAAFAPIYFLRMTALTDKINVRPLYRICAAVCAASVLCIIELLAF